MRTRSAFGPDLLQAAILPLARSSSCRTNGATRHIPFSRAAGERDLETVSRASRRPALGDRENGDHARDHDGLLFRVPLRARARDAGAASRYRSKDRRAARPWYHRFDRDLVSSRVLCRDCHFLSAAALFCRRICVARAHRGRERFSLSGDRRQLCPLSSWRVGLLFLAAAEDDSLLLSRHGVAWLDADVDGAAILFFCDAVHDRLWPRLRTAGRRLGAGAFWAGHLPVHGAHPTVRDRAHLHSRDDHHTDARRAYARGDGVADVFAL